MAVVMVVVIRLSEKRRSIKITRVAIPNMHCRGIKKILLRATRLLIPLPAMRQEIILLIRGGRGVQAAFDLLRLQLLPIHMKTTVLMPARTSTIMSLHTKNLYTNQEMVITNRYVLSTCIPVTH